MHHDASRTLAVAGLELWSQVEGIWKSTAPVPLGALRRTLPVVRPAVPAKPPGIQTVGLTPQMRTQVVPRTIVTSASASTPFVQRLQPKPQVTQRAYTPSVPTQISRANTSAVVPGGYASNTGTWFLEC